METPLVNQSYLLEKFAGKGGWTYAAIPEILQDKSAPFGWVKVKGTIDGYEIKNYHLMPMGNGRLFLPVKAAIRKAIRKKEGDWVQVILYADNSAVEIPEELVLCLQAEPNAYESFLTYTDGEKKAFIDWIYAAKTEVTQTNRIVQTIEKVLNGEKLYSPSKSKDHEN